MSIERLKTVLSGDTDIDLAIVFGSVARQTADSQSDVDIA
ncbi:MAG: nucleotidyltransferase domain-containing protein, partial [Rudaea sp.]